MKKNDSIALLFSKDWFSLAHIRIIDVEIKTKIIDIIWLIIKSKIYLLLFICFLSLILYNDAIKPETKPTSGSCIAYNQNHSDVGFIKYDKESVMIPAKNPINGPKIQPIIINGVHDNDMLVLIVGMLITKYCIINLKEINIDIAVINLVFLKILKGYSGKKNNLIENQNVFLFLKK